MKQRKLLLPMLTLAAALSGCASFPENYEKPVSVKDVVAEMKDTWAYSAPVTFVKSRTGVALRKYNEVPAEVANRHVSVNFTAGTNASLDDLLYAMRSQGFNVVSRLQGSSSIELLVRNYQGPLGGLLEELSHVQNVAYEFRNGVVFITETNRFAVSLPQNKTLLDKVSEAVKSMGATDSRVDVMAGLVQYTAKPDVANYVEEYLSGIAKNSAMVNLQVAVLTVNLNRDRHIGFDWAQTVASAGSSSMMTGARTPVASSSSGTGTGTGSGTGGSGSGTGGVDATPAADPFANAVGSLVTLNGASGFGYRFANKAFSLTAAIKALSTYGTARTEQNVVLGTLSGLPVKINSGNDIPYVKSIGSSTTSGGGTSGSTQTEIIKSGLKLDVTPNFDAYDKTITTEVKVDMSSLVGFRELSAGINLGTLSHPEMQTLGFENVSRVNAGETIVVGGITYDQLSDGYTNFPGAEKLPIGSETNKVSRHAIYIVVRPTVIVFTPDADELNAQQAAAQAMAGAIARGEMPPRTPGTADAPEIVKPPVVEAATEAPAAAPAVEAPPEAKQATPKKQVNAERSTGKPVVAPVKGAK